MDSEEFELFLITQGYMMPRQLPDGTWIALHQLMYTVGLCYGLDEYGWKKRWCYEDRVQALHALLVWDGKGDPPGPWVARRGVK